MSGVAHAAIGLTGTPAHVNHGQLLRLGPEMATSKFPCLVRGSLWLQSLHIGLPKCSGLAVMVGQHRVLSVVFGVGVFSLTAFPPKWQLW